MNFSFILFFQCLLKGRNKIFKIYRNYFVSLVTVVNTLENLTGLSIIILYYLKKWKLLLCHFASRVSFIIGLAQASGTYKPKDQR